jgi:phosphoglucomutase
MTSTISPLAGKLLPPSALVDVSRLVSAYFALVPDPSVVEQQVRFGTSGHRGSSLRLSFNETHVLAISQAICQHRRTLGIDGPMFVGIDTHALSWPALVTALEVFVANGVDVFIDEHDATTPTPVISHAILTYNRGRTHGLADGVVITPSHNPPEDGGFKYNPPQGGAAATDVTKAIETQANALIADGLKAVRRLPYAQARASSFCHAYDFITPYVAGLADIVDMAGIKAAGVKIGIDPLGGASIPYWPRIIERYGIAATVISDEVDPTFRFVPADWDGQIRMDCSSPYAMSRLIGHHDTFDVAFANDTDADRHGIVAGPDGLMPPNHFLSAAIDYLFANRPAWNATLGIGKTIVSSAMIDRVVKRLDRPLIEVPVGFKWFVDGLLGGTIGFAGEESGGAAFLRHDGSVWTTDKDGLIMGLLAAEMTARGKGDPSEAYRELTDDLGISYYARTDAPATAAQKALLLALAQDELALPDLAGDPIVQTLTAAPGNHAAIGGLKVVSANGWFALRPSGTEEIFKIYAESFQSEEHMQRIRQQAEDAANKLFATAAAKPA